MKTLFTFFICLFGLGYSAQSQTTAVQSLEQAKVECTGIKTQVTQARKLSNQLSKQLLLPGIPSSVAFESGVSTCTNQMQNHVEALEESVAAALLASGNGFNPGSINQSIQLMVAQIDILDGLRAQIVQAIQAQNKALAQQLIPQFNAALSRQTTLANQTIKKLDKAIDLIRPYQVCVRTVDSNGNPVAASDLFGFYCVKAGTQTLIEPSNQEGTCWTLPAGTYEFGSYPGYFSGTSSNTVTLTRSLENADGQVLVDLVYWSE
jgi:hypothetical protein